MSALTAIADRIKGQVSGITSLVRTRLFGANNEKLDFLMDSFYKLSPEQRNGVLAGVVGGIGVFVLGAVWFYFAQVDGLKRDLSNSFGALHELQAMRGNFETENKNFEKLVDTIGKRTRQVQLKPFFEKTAQDLGSPLEGLQDQRAPLAADNALSEKMQESRIEMRLTNVSIPRLMSFMVEVEKSNKYLRVRDLTIRGRYGNKLFFDSQLKVRGYEVN